MNERKGRPVNENLKKFREVLAEQCKASLTINGKTYPLKAAYTKHYTYELTGAPAFIRINAEAMAAFQKGAEDFKTPAEVCKVYEQAAEKMEELEKKKEDEQEHFEILEFLGFRG